MPIFIIFWFALGGYAVDAEYGSGVVAPIECVGVACDNDRADKPAMEPAMQDVPDVPDGPDVPDAPGDKPANNDKPGWGHGDKNHDHKGPPGREK